MIVKKDNLKLGLLLAAIVPLVVFIFIYLFKFSYYSVNEFYNVFMQETRLITFFSAWCLLANIALFTLYINTNKYQTAKGIFIITIIYGILFFLLKLFA